MLWRPLILSTVLLAGCSSKSLSIYSEDAAGEADSGGSGGSSDWDDTASADDGDDFEPEEEQALMLPAVTPAYVFVANPDRGTVSRIAVPDLDVLTTAVGSNPTLLSTTADGSRAVVFNQGDDSVSIVDAATLSVVTVSVRDDLNAMALSPDGKWAALWHDRASEEDEPNSEGVVSYNELSLVDVETATHWPQVVGFNPREVQFTADSATAVVVSDAWLGVIGLDDEPTTTRIAIADDIVDPPEAEEVLVAPDGSYAFVRQFGADTLALVDLVAGEVDRLAVGSNPTDLDLSPDGLEVVVVARNAGELWIYDLLDPMAGARTVAMPVGEVLGSLVLSPNGNDGLLYSNATGLSRYTTWDRLTDTLTTRSLVKPVDSMEFSPDGQTALAFHPKDNGSDVDTDSEFYDRWALTMIEVGSYFGAPLRLAAEPTEWASSDDGSRAFFIMEGQPWLEVLRLDALMFDEVELHSDPLHVGVLPGTTWAFASQEHVLGRISFYDADTTVLKTITGFELNAGIEHGD
jgi:DNA-binding beta-propeller fold protein YncE